MTGRGGLASAGVVVLAVAGQSNAEGRAHPIGPELDPPDPRIAMWDWGTSSLRQATVPLSSRRMQDGLSIATVVAREILAHEGVALVVIVNAAVGGSPLARANDRGTWRWGEGSLADGFVEAVRATIRLLADRAPDAGADVRMLWHQGESDVDPVAYERELDRLVAGVRERLELPELTVVLGGMVPEHVAQEPRLAAIRAVHVDTPRRLRRTAYVDGIPCGGGSAGAADVLHYAREGAERLGRGMHAAHRRALVNTEGSIPVPVMDLVASRRGTAVVASWSAPLCRVTGFLVEHSADGERWIEASSSMETTAVLDGGVRSVRVTTLNEEGRSAPAVASVSGGA